MHSFVLVAVSCFGYTSDFANNRVVSAAGWYSSSESRVEVFRDDLDQR